MEYELYHYGVKGMKWGVRRYQNKDGSLTDRGIKKYAKKGYAQDSMRSNKTIAGKAWDAYTGAHKSHADIIYDTSSKKKNRDRAERYLRDKEKNNRESIKKKSVKVVAKGAVAATKAASKIGLAYMTDQIFYNGAGTRACKEAVKNIGMAVITAYTMARGGHDIKWYDQYGRRIG